MKQSYFHNILPISWWILKRDKFRIAIWILSISLFELFVAYAIVTMYPTESDRLEFAVVMDNPAMVAMFGRAYGDVYTFGAMWSHMMYVWVGMMVGIMGIMLVSRHLRGEEEEGRYEMIRSFPVGRDAYLGATMLVMLVTFLLLAVVKGISFSFVGIDSITLGGSLMYAFGLAGLGVFFVGLSAVFAQLFQSTRTVMATSFSAFLLFYIIFSIGQVADSAIAWLSPFHMMVSNQAYVGNVVWPTLLLFVLAIGFAALANYLSSIRDLNAGFIEGKPGKTRLSRFVNRPFGFALKLYKTPFIIWAIGMAFFGMTYGSIFGDLESYIENNELISQALADIPGIPLATQFMGIIMMVLSIVAMIPALMSFNRLSALETKGQLELYASHPVSKQNLVLSHLGLALLIGTTTLFLGGFGLWSAAYGVMDDPIPLGTITTAAMVYLPALIVLLGLSLLVLGYLPGKTWIIYTYIGYGWFTVYLGQLMDFNDWIMKTTPFGFVPRIPVDDINWVTQLLLSAVGIGLGYLGWLKYRARDLRQN